MSLNSSATCSIPGLFGERVQTTVMVCVTVSPAPGTVGFSTALSEWHCRWRSWTRTWWMQFLLVAAATALNEDPISCWTEIISFSAFLQTNRSFFFPVRLLRNDRIFWTRFIRKKNTQKWRDFFKLYFQVAPMCLAEPESWNCALQVAVPSTGDLHVTGKSYNRSEFYDDFTWKCCCCFSL